MFYRKKILYAVLLLMCVLYAPARAQIYNIVQGKCPSPNDVQIRVKGEVCESFMFVYDCRMREIPLCISCDSKKSISKQYIETARGVQVLSDIKSAMQQCPNRQWNEEKEQSERISCSPFAFMDRFSNCIPCDRTDTYNASAEECAKCPNRKMLKDRCILSECPADQPLHDERGICYSCDTEGLTKTSAEDCARCPNRTFSNGYCMMTKCPPDKPLRTGTYQCASCDDKVSMRAENCEKCPNRKKINEFCVFDKHCPADQPMLSVAGKCYSCDDPVRKTDPSYNVRHHIETSAEECAKCPNRTLLDNVCVVDDCPSDKPLLSKEGYCYPCDSRSSSEVIRTSEKECSQCPNRIMSDGICEWAFCPEDTPVQDTLGHCFSCDRAKGMTVLDSDLPDNTDDQTFYEIVITPQNCLKCPGMTIVNNRCLHICPADKPLRNTNGGCHACEGYPVEIHASQEECNKCAQTRVMKDDMCVLQCPPDRPLQANYHCYSCDETNSDNLFTSPEECLKCPNRRMFDGRCILSQCPDDSPIQDNLGNCYACDSHDVDALVITDNASLQPLPTFGIGFVEVSTTKQSCEKCSNRIVVGNRCVLTD